MSTITTMSEQERAQHAEIVAGGVTTEQREAARRFLESSGFQYTTTALRAMAAVMRGDYENEEMGALLDGAAEAMALIEAVTI